VLPAGFSYLGELNRAAAHAKQAGIVPVPQIAVANRVGTIVERLQASREALSTVVARAEESHDDVVAQARLLTSEAADRMAEVREASDALELAVGDDHWPLPKYREMLFPV
jgi:glutamine synthetase